jgi:C1A family cysteine protease
LKRSLVKKAAMIALSVSIIFCNENIEVFATQTSDISTTSETAVDTDIEASTTGEVSEEKNIDEPNSQEIESDASQVEEVPISTGYIDDEFVIPSISENYEANTSTISADSISKDTTTDEITPTNATTYESNSIGEIPASYSFKDKMPAVREQGSFGVCWSFAAVGAGEASLILKGLADKTLDLSELQLAYFFYHSVADPLGNTTGDTNQALGSDYLNVGGNSVFTTFALAGWTGLADEAKAPYGTASTTGTLDNSLSYDDAYHMQNAYWINLSTDVAEVKKMIMKYGAVASAHYTDQSTTTGSTACYNPATYAYFYDGSYKTNHAIVIVGWDDNYSKSNFNASKQPTNDGAWLVRNSWGSTLGDQGYFWISYEDSAFNSDSFSKAFVFDFEPGDNYDHNYQYDGTSGANGYSLASGGSIANIFTASGNSTGAQEKIDAVSFALYDVNVNYSIQIYTDITDTTNPTSGTARLLTPKTGSTSYVGYYTIPLDEPVVVNEGEKFAIVITLSKNDGSTTYFFGDKSYQNDTWIKFTNVISSGQSFRKNDMGSNWYDLNSSGVTARIKAFTTDIATPIVEATQLSLSESTITMSKEQSRTLTATVLPENATNKSITWTSSDSNVAIVDSNGLIIAVAPGTATITAKTSNNLTASCTINVINKDQTTTNEKISKTNQSQDSTPENEDMVEIPIIVSPDKAPGTGAKRQNNVASKAEDSIKTTEEEESSSISDSALNEDSIGDTTDSNQNDTKNFDTDTEKDAASKGNIETTIMHQISNFATKNGNLVIAIGLLCLLPTRKLRVNPIKSKDR